MRTDGPAEAHLQKNELDAGYRATTYQLMLPVGVCRVRVGISPPPALTAWLHDLQVDGGVWVTAENPGSKRFGIDDNARRNKALQALLMQRVDEAERIVAVIEGVALPDDAVWPPESGFFAAGLAIPQAMALGRKFGQLAVLSCPIGKPAELVWCDAQHDEGK